MSRSWIKVPRNDDALKNQNLETCGSNVDLSKWAHMLCSEYKNDVFSCDLYS